jgi:hypothetical protein
VPASVPRLLLVTVLLLLVAVPATAHAGTREKIVADCYDDGNLDGNYSPSEIRDARNNLPADIDQYSDCRDVLGRALGGSGDKQVGGGGAGGGALGGGGGGGGSGGGPAEPLTPSGPQEQTELDKAALAGGDRPVQVGGGTVVPGAAGLASDATRNPIPVTLLVALILLGLAALAGATPYVLRRLHARRLA